MQQQVSHLIGLDDFEVKEVSGAGEQLDLEVEPLARAGSCPRCDHGPPEIKERPPVRVRDLPIGGRKANLLWRKRPHRHPASPERTSF